MTPTRHCRFEFKFRGAAPDAVAAPAGDSSHVGPHRRRTGLAFGAAAANIQETFKMIEPSVRPTAFHEAGHAVVARAMGSRVRCVRIGAEPLAHCAHRASAPVAMAVTYLAGALAERRVSPIGPWGASIDEKMALEACARFADEPDKAIPVLRALAQALLDARWPQVEIIAAALIARGRLTGQEIDALIRF